MKKFLFVALTMIVLVAAHSDSFAQMAPPCDPLTQNEVWTCGPCGECGCPELTCVPKERYGCDPAEQASLAGTDLEGKMTSICDGSAYNNSPITAIFGGSASPSASQQEQIDRVLGDVITTFESTTAQAEGFAPTVNVDAVSILTNVEATRADVTATPPGASNYVSLPILGNPGDQCPTNSYYFVQTDQTSCGCDNPITLAANECIRGAPGTECLPDFPGMYLQNDQMTCACNNPLTDGDECGPPLGSPGDPCPLVPGEFIQSDGYDCDCDSPSTPYDECPGPLGSAGDVCPTNPSWFVSANTYTCECDNPTTAANECLIGNPGDVCPTNAAWFVQNDQLTCGCDNPTTVANECGGGGGGGGGCFAAATDIMMEDGTLKKIVDLKIGDRVMSYDKTAGVGSDLFGGRVTHIFLMGEKDVYDVAGTHVTGTHPFQTGEGKLVALQDMKPEDTIVMADGSTIVRGDIKIVGREPVYNFTVEGTHAYIAGDMRVGNMTVSTLPEGVYTESDLLLQTGAVAKH